jgi:hypothetical protein
MQPGDGFVPSQRTGVMNKGRMGGGNGKDRYCLGCAWRSVLAGASEPVLKRISRDSKFGLCFPCFVAFRRWRKKRRKKTKIAS